MENKPQKNNSRIAIAFILIGIGVLWILRKLGFYIDLPNINWHTVFAPFRHVFYGWGHFIFSWQVILIITGLILLAGKRSVGIVLIIIGGVFLIPKFFHFTGLTFSLILPVLLIGIGLAMVVKKTG
jgi:hypothetical protein